MPMNAPVIPTTGTDLVPTSYICGRIWRKFFQRSQLGPMLRNVRATNTQKSPNAANTLFVRRPMSSTKLNDMGRDHSGCSGDWGVWPEVDTGRMKGRGGRGR